MFSLYPRFPLTTGVQDCKVGIDIAGDKCSSPTITALRVFTPTQTEVFDNVSPQPLLHLYSDKCRTALPNLIVQSRMDRLIVLNHESLQ